MFSPFQTAFGQSYLSYTPEVTVPPKQVSPEADPAKADPPATIPVKPDADTAKADPPATVPVKPDAGTAKADPPETVPVKPDADTAKADPPETVPVVPVAEAGREDPLIAQVVPPPMPPPPPPPPPAQPPQPLERDPSMVLPEILFKEVEQGKGSAVYPQLKKQFEFEMESAARDWSRDVMTFHRDYLFYLLKAGEGVAPVEEQEITARAFVENYPTDLRFPTAFFILNQALFLQGKPLESSFLFDDRAMASLTRKMQARYLVMLSDDKALGQDYLAAARLLLEAQNLQPEQSEVYKRRIEVHLEKVTNTVALRTLLQAHKGLPWLQKRAPFHLARVYLNEGMVASAARQLAKIVQDGLIGTEADRKKFDTLKEELNSRKSIQPYRIGVLLPLSSSSELLRSLARQTFEGLRMAVQFPRIKKDPGAILPKIREDITDQDATEKQGPSQPTYFELVVRDSAGSPALARRQVEALVEEDHVAAIIGPIARAESEAAVKKAEELGVPLISLSLSLKIPEGAKYIFRHSKSQSEEVRDLVRFARDYLHARRFAILYPDSGYGSAMMRQFWDEVDRQGGKVVAVSSYQRPRRVSQDRADRVKFDRIFGKFTGKDRPIDPADVVLADKVKDQLPDPIVDFDAIFIPVGPNGIQDLQLIAPYPITVDAEHVDLLGSRFWNNIGLPVVGNGRLEGAVFIDSFDPKSLNVESVGFRGQHRTTFGHRRDYRPPNYYTGLGFDTAKMVVNLLRNPKNRSRKHLARALREMDAFFGVTGWTRFRKTGESVKESMFFHVKRNEIVRFNP